MGLSMDEAIVECARGEVKGGKGEGRKGLELLKTRERSEGGGGSIGRQVFFFSDLDLLGLFDLNLNLSLSLSRSREEERGARPVPSRNG